MAGWCQCVNRSFSLGMATGLQRQKIFLISEFEQQASMESFAYIYMDLRNVSCLIATSGNLWKRDASRQKPEPLDNDCFPVSVSTEPVYGIDQFGHSYSNPYKVSDVQWRWYEENATHYLYIQILYIMDYTCASLAIIQMKPDTPGILRILSGLTVIVFTKIFRSISCLTIGWESMGILLLPSEA